MSRRELLRELAERAAEGDDVALSRLVRATEGDVWRLCSSLGSTGEVEDLVQETYLRMVRSMPGYRGDADVRSWLLAIARNVCADHVRRRQRQRKLLDRVSQSHVGADVPPPTEPDSLLATLPKDRREAFVLTQVLDLSYEEAAAVLGCPIGTIRSRVHRAREDLAAAARRGAATG